MYNDVPTLASNNKYNLKEIMITLPTYIILIIK